MRLLDATFQYKGLFFLHNDSNPFIYLGILISPGKLVTVHFHSMVDKVNKAITGWGLPKVFKTGKIIFINNVLVSLRIQKQLENFYELMVAIVMVFP